MIGNNNLRISKYECFNKKGSVTNVGVEKYSIYVYVIAKVR